MFAFLSDFSLRVLTATGFRGSPGCAGEKEKIKKEREKAGFVAFHGARVSLSTMPSYRCFEAYCIAYIARNVTEGPATHAGMRSTLKTVDHGKMMAEEEKIAVVAVVAVKKNWKHLTRWGQKQLLTAVFSHFGIKTRFFLTLWELSSKLFMENGTSSTRWRVARRVIRVEEVPSNWQQRGRFCKVSYRIVCTAMADLSVSLAEFSRKNAWKPWCWDVLKCTFCVQKRWTSSFERGDSLTCVCEERFLKKGWGKSCFTLKFYCPVPCIPRVYAIHFYGRPVAIWFAADFLQWYLQSALLGHPPESKLRSIQRQISCGKKVADRAREHFLSVFSVRILHKDFNRAHISIEVTRISE